MTLTSSWCVLINRVIELESGDFKPDVSMAFGPFDKKNATEMADDFNEEYDGSPYSATVRPLLRLSE